MKKWKMLAVAALSFAAAGAPMAAGAQDWHGDRHGDGGWHGDGDRHGDGGWHGDGDHHRDGDWHRWREQRAPGGWIAGPGWHPYLGLHHRHCWWGHRWHRPVRYCN